MNEIVYTNIEKDYRMKQIRHNVQEEIYTVALVPRLTGNSYFDAAEEGAQEAAEKLGVNLIITGSSVADYKEQQKVIEKLILKKVDAIAIAANDPFKLLPILNKARDQGIKVITWDSDTDPTGRDFFVNAVDPETLGKHLMDNLAASLNEKGEYAILTNYLSTSSSTEWIRWIKIQQKNFYPDMKLVRIMTSYDNYDLGFKNVQYLLENYPNLSGVVGISPGTSPAAAQAIIEAKRRDVKIVGLSPPNSMKEYIHGGVVENITLWSPKKLGYLTVALAKNMLDGQFPVHQQEIPDVGSIKVKDNIVIMGEPIIFTKENIDQYDF
ncbi:autoinducer 2 ABC transporter substrate-binding protein [Peribacillus sp. NJ11]|uniref:autoinducer 2 ABC transporter substrate-binding protein n=1 Tax=Peribacillus sp. NJ11 TaxID=3055861 RepID=UPI0025A21863|nr:autoinducer 2 ABC transporter substrate-binding protein [Peribacillus sp. NJ11]MDM5224582.1 autoinducer 2 ABC transporter substrate-binding protein [Peribacillus sp. NJ11]